MGTHFPGAYDARFVVPTMASGRPRGPSWSFPLQVYSETLHVVPFVETVPHFLAGFFCASFFLQMSVVFEITKTFHEPNFSPSNSFLAFPFFFLGKKEALAQVMREPPAIPSRQLFRITRSFGLSQLATLPFFCRGRRIFPPPVCCCLLELSSHSSPRSAERQFPCAFSPPIP